MRGAVWELVTIRKLESRRNKAGIVVAKRVGNNYILVKKDKHCITSHHVALYAGPKIQLNNVFLPCVKSSYEPFDCETLVLRVIQKHGKFRDQWQYLTYDVELFRMSERS